MIVCLLIGFDSQLKNGLGLDWVVFYVTTNTV